MAGPVLIEINGVVGVCSGAGIANGTATVTEAGTTQYHGTKTIHVTSPGIFYITLPPSVSGYLYINSVRWNLAEGTVNTINTISYTGTGKLVIYVPKVLPETVLVDSILGSAIDTMSFKVRDTSNSLVIPEGVDIVAYWGTTNEIIFGGLISSVDASIEGRTRVYEVKAQDYTVLLDTTIVYASYIANYTYGGLTGAKAIIADLFETKVVGGANIYSEIEARTYVEDPHVSMTAIKLENVTLREALSTIASYTQNNYYVDYEKHLHFYYFTSANYTAAYPLSDVPDYATNYGYRNIHWKRDATQLRNSFLLIGAQFYSEIMTYILANDGVQTTLSLKDGCGVSPNQIVGNKLLAPMPGHTQISVWTNTGDYATDLSPVWEALTVGVDGSDTLTSYDVLFNQIQQKLVFKVAPPSWSHNSVMIGCTYLYNTSDGRQVAGSLTKYGRYFTKRVSLSDPNTANGYTSIFQSLEREYAYALSKITLTVDDKCGPNNSTRLKVGQVVGVTNAALGLAAANDKFLIHRKLSKIAGGTLMTYDLELRNWFTNTIGG